MINDGGVGRQMVGRLNFSTNVHRFFRKNRGTREERERTKIKHSVVDVDKKMPRHTFNSDSLTELVLGTSILQFV